jgi:hypothetical protein
MRLLGVRCSLAAAMDWRLLSDCRRASAEATDDPVVVQGRLGRWLEDRLCQDVK